MPSATQVLGNVGAETETYSLVGNTSSGALYKVATRPLALPKTMEFKFSLGTPGSLGNDRLAIIFQDAQQNEDTGKISVITAKLELSVPRDIASSETAASDLLSNIASLLTDGNIASIYDGIVP